MSTQGGEVKYVFTADTSQLQAAMARGEAAITQMATSAETAMTRASTAVTSVSDAEKKWIATTTASEAATKSRAAALGISVSKLNAMNEALKAAPAPAKAATVAMAALDEETQGVSTNSSKALKALGPIGGVLSRISPELGAVSSSVASLTSGLEGLEAGIVGGVGPAMTALGTVLAVVGVAYVEITGVIDDYTAAEDAATHAAEMHKAALQPLGDAIKAERKERDMLLEALNSSAPAEALKVAERQLKVDEMEAAATADLRKEREGLVKVVDAAGVKRTLESQLAENRIKQIDQEIEAVARQGDEYVALQGQTEELRMVAASYTGELVKHEDAISAAASADAAWAKVLSDGVLYNLELNMEASKKRAKIEKENAEIIAKAGEEAAMRQWEAEEALRQRRIEMEAERTALYAKGIEDRRELDLQAAESAVSIAENAADLIIQLAESEADTRSDIVDRLQQKLADGEDTLTKRQKQNIRERIKENKDAARTAFRISQAVAAVQAAISTALAIVNALASPVPYPVAVGFAVAAGIAGAASEAAILSEKPPTFHTGGVFAADEGMAKLRNGEGVLTPETTRNLGGAAGIAEMNRRQGIAGGGTVLRIGRREVAEMERMGVLGGGPRNRQIRNEVRRGSIIAGRSGKGVLA